MNRRSIITSLILFLCVAGLVSAQDSTGISFQALVQSDVGSTSNTTIGVRLSILRDSSTGPSVYTERQTPMSNQYGMITLEIGTGTAESGTFGDIDWSTGRYFIKSEIDPAGGTNYSITGTYEQLSVPYAFFAREAGSAPRAGKAESVSVRVSDTGDTLFVGSGGQFVVIPGISPPPSLPDGYVACDPANPMVINTVTSSTGKIWLDRNLGARQVATASTDTLGYGDLYQWGRFADGHQCRNSDVVALLATTADVNSGDAWYGKFVTTSASPHDWLSSQDGNLWQGLDGTNNPCPAGFRLPTETEWEAEVNSWDAQKLADAMASPLILPATGYRDYYDGGTFNVGSCGNYWSSTIDGTLSKYVDICATSAYTDGITNRAVANAVRCIKD